MIDVDAISVAVGRPSGDLPNRSQTPHADAIDCTTNTRTWRLSVRLGRNGRALRCAIRGGVAHRHSLGSRAKTTAWLGWVKTMDNKEASFSRPFSADSPQSRGPWKKSIGRSSDSCVSSPPSHSLRSKRTMANRWTRKVAQLQRPDRPGISPDSLFAHPIEFGRATNACSRERLTGIRRGGYYQFAANGSTAHLTGKIEITANQTSIEEHRQALQATRCPAAPCRDRSDAAGSANSF